MKTNYEQKSNVIGPTEAEPTPTDLFSLHNKFVQYGQNAKEWTRKCMLLLPKIEKYRIWQTKGFSSIYEYAAKLAGMSRHQVNEGLRILKKLENKPALKQIVAEKGIWAVKPASSIATKETAEFWAEKCRSMSVRSLECYVKEFRIASGLSEENQNNTASNIQQNIFFENQGRHVAAVNRDLQKNPTEASDNQGLFKNNDKMEPGACTTQSENSTANPPPPLSAPPPQTGLFLQLSPQTLNQLEKLKGQNTWGQLFQTLLTEREKYYELTKPKPVKTHSRPIPAKIKKYVLQKANNTCQFPGCTKSAEILHHTKRFSLTKTHDPDHIAPLCKEHERLCHLGLVENEDKPPQTWKVRLKPDKTDLKYLIDQRVNEHRRKKTRP